MLGENKNYSRIENLDAIDNIHSTSRFSEVVTNLIKEYIVDVVNKWAIQLSPRVFQQLKRQLLNWTDKMNWKTQL